MSTGSGSAVMAINVNSDAVKRLIMRSPIVDAVLL